MKIVFFGTSDFAVCVLNKLWESKHTILKVVTACDKRKGRGQRIAFSPVKIFAQDKKLPLLQPANLQDKEFLRDLKNKPVALFVVCDYGKILTKEVLQIPLRYAINLHTSLLPKYRGAAPINWALIQGEKETGVSVFKMNEYMDEGEIILQRKISILASDTSLSLTEKLSRIGVEALLEAIELIECKRETLTSQDETQVSFAPKFKKADGLIDWQFPADEIYNRIRGLQPWPGAFTYLENKLLKVWQGQVIQERQEAKPGEIVELDPQKGILVQTGKEQLLITELQLEGKRKMSVNEFILGHKIKKGEKLG